MFYDHGTYGGAVKIHTIAIYVIHQRDIEYML